MAGPANRLSEIVGQTSRLPCFEFSDRSTTDYNSVLVRDRLEVYKMRIICPFCACVALLAAPRLTAQTYTFTTLAGSAGDGSADGFAISARFNSPSGAAVDAATNVYVADYANNTIRKITPSGIVTTLAGLEGAPGHTDGTGTAARFSGPVGVTLDSSNNLFVTDFQNQTIRRISPAGAGATTSRSPRGGGANERGRRGGP